MKTLQAQEQVAMEAEDILPDKAGLNVSADDGVQKEGSSDKNQMEDGKYPTHILLYYSGFNFYNLRNKQNISVIFFIDIVHKQINMHADGD